MRGWMRHGRYLTPNALRVGWLGGRGTSGAGCLKKGALLGMSLAMRANENGGIDAEGYRAKSRLATGSLRLLTLQ